MKITKACFIVPERNLDLLMQSAMARIEELQLARIKIVNEMHLLLSQLKKRSY